MTVEQRVRHTIHKGPATLAGLEACSLTPENKRRVRIEVQRLIEQGIVYVDNHLKLRWTKYY